ncbi:hypothetical protein CYMTET_14291 [Cymbomonas tetramitiformis]|uniref:Uncharacterized protein n=1 Tax=Cymbomonas tetramitiformis TaxID=36881 RepID=A0AAE0GGM8_9CHLO|nr:hypothetical protein CYMTET_49757 [Cymbomonas tetramitiformis]KAK3277708.1 hypothetical protein CYMTET_14291 [Cymbomonas tetramitiformis]
MPVDAQTAVACARSALHTAADLVCVDLSSGASIVVEVRAPAARISIARVLFVSPVLPMMITLKMQTGRIAVDQVKCGFDDYADEHNDFMRHELRRLDNSPRNQHQLQLAITTELFRRSYPKLHLGDGYIIRAMTRGVYYERLGTWARSAAPAALRRMGGAAATTRV